MPEKEKYPNSGHRERLKKRFEKSGFQGFNDYEILELLLSYAIPRIDVKPMAKRLLKKYKNFHNILKSDMSDLLEVEGIGRQSATFLKVIQATIQYHAEERIKESDIQFTKLITLVQYLRSTIGFNHNEVVHVLYLNSKNELIDSENLSEGTVNQAIAFPRKIVEGALKNKATSVIIAHNHPGGVAEPSEQDNKITKEIKEALSTVNISLQEHVIILDNDYYSYRQHGFFD